MMKEKGRVLACLKLISGHPPGRTEEKQEKLRTMPVLWSTFDLGTK